MAVWNPFHHDHHHDDPSIKHIYTLSYGALLEEYTIAEKKLTKQGPKLCVRSLGYDEREKVINAPLKLSAQANYDDDNWVHIWHNNRHPIQPDACSLAHQTSRLSLSLTSAAKTVAQLQS